METLEGLLAERLLDQAPVAVVATDLDLTIAVWTDAAESLFGWTAEEAVGRDVLALVVPEADTRTARQIVDRLRRGDSWQGEFPGLRRDGAALRLLIAAGPVRDAAGAVAGLIAVALDAGELIDQTRERRLELLAQTSELLTATLDAEAALQTVARLAVSWLADVCIVDLTVPGGFERVAVAHSSPDRQEAADGLRAFPADPAAPHIRAVVEESRSELVADLTDTLLDRLLQGPEHVAIVKALDLRSAMFVPLAARGTVLGVMILAAARDRSAFGPQDVSVAEEVARRVALALDNARLRRRAEDAARTAHSLQLISDAALSHLSLGQLLPEVLDRVDAELGTDTAAVLLADDTGERLVLRASLGLESAVEDVSIPVGSGVAGRIALADGPVARDGLTAEDFASPALRASPVRSILGAPLRVGGRVIGVIQVGSVAGRTFTAQEVELVRLAADRIALAVDHARLYEAESAARDRLALLAEASAVLGESLDYRSALDRLARLVVPRLGDWCAIELAGDPRDAVVVAHADPTRVRLARDLLERYPPDPDAEAGAAAVIRSGEAELHPVIGPEMLAALARDEDHLRLLQSLELRAAVVVPLQSRGRVLGAITLVSAESGRTYSRADVAFATELARRAATAVDTARLFQERDQVARTLQRSLLPPSLPDIPGVEVAAVYHPAGEGGEIGGDFYDVFERAPGEWVLAVGDVCGKGTAAAAITGLARHTLRAAAAGERSPAQILRLLNGSLLRQVRDETFCTVALAVIRPAGDGVEVTAAAGGHPPPLVLRAGTPPAEGTTPGTLLGVYEEIETADSVHRLARGDAIAFYTDGVTEARRAGRMFGEERLRTLLAECAGMSAAGIAERMERAVAEYWLGPPRDDVAILVARAGAR
jgi:PAS domain S-box-containing protein